MNSMLKISLSFFSLTMYSLIDLVNKLNKSYVVWQEIFDNGLKVYHDVILLDLFCHRSKWTL